MNDPHDPIEALPAPARDAHGALASLKEEIDAVDLYHGRIVACTEPELLRVLEHNRNEEMEHAAMLLEWLRRTMPAWDAALRTYLFTTAPITEVEKGAAGPTETGAEPGLGIGSLKGT